MLLVGPQFCSEQVLGWQVVTLSGGQLGYRQSVINFISDNASTVHALPRLPSQIKVLVYDKTDKDGNVHVLRVRRAAVVGYLRFFMKHNPLYQGVVGCGIPPVQEVAGNWHGLPEDGPLVGVTVEQCGSSGEHGDCMESAPCDLTSGDGCQSEGTGAGSATGGEQAGAKTSGAKSAWCTAMGGLLRPHVCVCVLCVPVVVCVVCGGVWVAVCVANPAPCGKFHLCLSVQAKHMSMATHSSSGLPAMHPWHCNLHLQSKLAIDMMLPGGSTNTW